MHKKLTLQVSSQGQYQNSLLKIEDRKLEESLFKVVVNAALNYSINKHFNATWSTYYTSPFLYGLYQVEGQFINNVDFVYAGDSFKVGLGMQDIFKAGIWDSTLKSETYNTRWINRWQNGIVKRQSNHVPDD